jgi:NAD(P)-dependent dehydrogenase (short-subunit alcohol dehydrogenase family)
VSLDGKVVLLTGASRGIGRAAAERLAALGATMLLAVRDRAAGERAAAEIAAATGNRDLHVLVADLSRQADVRSLADQAAERAPRLDVLVNNAAIITRTRSVTADGIETQLAVNHLAPFLLTNLLLARLRASAPARIVTVASQAHHGHPIDLGDLQLADGYEPTEQYGRTKLMNILFTYELARRLAGSGVTANCLHPGVIDTNLLMDFMGAPRGSGRRMGGTPEQGADTLVWLASAPEVEGVSGKYFDRRREIRSTPQSYDRALASALWDASAALAGL